ncbi:MAG: hypothetical protein JJ992_21910 [Planctomycetes bacterium]|nr:hypothetical protein [Planctomycetota bacterium]
MRIQFMVELSISGMPWRLVVQTVDPHGPATRVAAARETVPSEYLSGDSGDVERFFTQN